MQNQELKIMNDQLFVEYLTDKGITHTVDEDGGVSVHHDRQFTLQGYDVYALNNLKELSDCEIYHSGTHAMMHKNEFRADHLKKAGKIRCDHTRILKLNALEEIDCIDSHSLPELVLGAKKIGDLWLRNATKLHINEATHVTGTISAARVTDFSADQIDDIAGNVFLSPKLSGKRENGIIYDSVGFMHGGVTRLYFEKQEKVKYFLSLDNEYPMTSLSGVFEDIDDYYQYNARGRPKYCWGVLQPFGPLEPVEEWEYPAIVSDFKRNGEHKQVAVKRFENFKENIEAFLSSSKTEEGKPPMPTSIPS